VSVVSGKTWRRVALFSVLAFLLFEAAVIIFFSDIDPKEFVFEYDAAIHGGNAGLQETIPHPDPVSTSGVPDEPAETPPEEKAVQDEAVHGISKVSYIDAVRDEPDNEELIHDPSDTSPAFTAPDMLKNYPAGGPATQGIIVAKRDIHAADAGTPDENRAGRSSFRVSPDEALPEENRNAADGGTDPVFGGDADPIADTPPAPENGESAGNERTPAEGDTDPTVTTPGASGTGQIPPDRESRPQPIPADPAADPGPPPTAPAPPDHAATPETGDADDNATDAVPTDAGEDDTGTPTDPVPPSPPEAPSTGFIGGRVYNDATGLPAGGIGVTLVRLNGTAPADPAYTATDDRGRYRLGLSRGRAVLRIAKEGYVPVCRTAVVRSDAVFQVRDARITAIDAGTPVSRLGGGSVAFESLGAKVAVPAGAFAEDVNLSFTRLSGQSLPGVLPLGWSPAAAYYVGVGAAIPNVPMILRLNSAETSPAVIAARWDEKTAAWTRVACALTGNERRIALDMPGGVVLVRPDVSPEAPNVPGIGEALTGVTPVPLPDALVVDILPKPEILFLNAGTVSDVRAVVDSAIPLPSGTRLTVTFTESYHQTDGTVLSPDPMAQDICLYPAAGGLSGRFVASPSIDLDAAGLEKGLIRLEAHRPEVRGKSSVVGRAGGAVDAGGGMSLIIPAGATFVDIPISLDLLSGLPPDVDLPAGIGEIAPSAAFTGVSVDLAGAALSDAATLFVPLSAASADDDRFLLVRAVIAGGASRYEIVSVGTPEPGGVIFDGAGLAVPGIRESGRYYMLRMRGPSAVLTGKISVDLLPAAAGLVETDRHPFVSLTDAADPDYVLVVPAGRVTVSGRDMFSGAAAASTITIASASSTVLDLSLETVRPVVLSVLPANDSDDVEIGSTVSVLFSRKMARQSLHSDAFRLSVAGGGAVDGRVSLSADGAKAVFSPASPLSDHTAYTVVLTDAVRDVYGNALQTGTPDGIFKISFTTRDNTPPPLPGPGEIAMPVPVDGATTLTGSRGTFAPGTVVTAVNLNTRATATVTAEDDGSFSLAVDADPAHKIELTLHDPAGNAAVYDPGPFMSPDGTTVIGAAGGKARGLTPGTKDWDGTEIIAPPDALPDGTVIRVSAADEAGMGIALPEILDGLGVLRLEMGDVIAGAEIKASMPAPEGISLTPDSQILVLQAVDFFGAREFTLVNVAKYKETAEGPRIETTSPPFCGLLMSGFYAFATPKPGMKPLVCGSVVPSAWLGSVRTMTRAGFRLVDHPKLPGYKTIIAVPAGHPFTVHAYDDSGGEIAAQPFDPPAEPFAELLIPAAEDLAGDLSVSEVRIGSGEDVQELVEGDVPTGVAVDADTAVIFTKQVTGVDDEKLVLERVNADGTAVVVRGAVTPKYGDVNGKKVLQGAVFAPDVRLKYDTEYRLAVRNLKDFAGNLMTGGVVRSFRTFRPRVIGSVAVAHPHDLDLLDVGGALKRLVVANGALAGDRKDDHGVMLIDVADPSRPAVLSEAPIAGNTLGVFAIRDAAVPDGLLAGPAVLAVSGGADVFGSMRIYNIGGERLDRLDYAGFKLLSIPEAYLFEGFTRPGVPPQSGIPRGVTLYGDDNAYMPVIGIGVLGVNLSEAIRQHQGRDVNHPPGKRVMYSAATVDTAGGAVLAGDLRELVLLSPDLTETYATLDISARYIHGVNGFPVGVDEEGLPAFADLAFVGDSGGRIHIIDVNDPRHPKILQRIQTGDFIRCIRADAERRLVYASSLGTVYVVDADDLLGPDWSRILGTVDGLSAQGGEISALAVDGRGIGYAAAPDQGRIHSLLLGCPDRRIYIESGEYPVPPGGRVTLKTEPDMDVRWEIAGVFPDTFNPKSVRLDPATGSLSVEAGAPSGRVRVRAVNEDIRGCDIETWIRVGCGCGTCVGKGEFALNSVDIRINLGAGTGGRPAGELLIHAEGIGEALANPTIIEHSVLGRDVAVVRGAAGVIRSIATGQNTVNVVSVADGFEVRFTAGGGGSPFVVWRFEMAGAEDDRRFAVSEIRNGSLVRKTTYDTDPGGAIRMIRSDDVGTPLREEVLEKRREGDSEIHLRTMVEDGRPAAEIRSEYRTFPWGMAVVESTVDPGGAALTTTYEYQSDKGAAGYGRLKRLTGPDGAATTYMYDAEDRLATESRPWCDAAGGRMIAYDYTPLPGDAGRAEDDTRPRIRTETVHGIVTSKTYFMYAYDAAGGERTEITERCTVPDAGWGDPSNLRTTRIYHAWGRNFDAGRLKSVVHPDGRTDTHFYETGVYSDSGNPGLPGRFFPGAGTDVRQSVVHGTQTHPAGVAYKTTREATVTDATGRTLMTETDVYTGMGYERMQWTVRILDDQGRLTAEYRSDGTTIENTWGCCRIAQSADARGLVTAFAYDGLDRLITETRESLNGDIVTETRYQVTDTGRTEIRTVSAGALRLAAETLYDRAGRTAQSTDAAGLVTRYTYQNDGRTTTVTHPGGITEITERYLDGRTRRVTGTGVVARHYAYGANPDGTRWTRVHTGDAGLAARRWEMTVTDMAGRTVRTEKPGFSGVEADVNVYDHQGRLVRREIPGQADTLYVYDELGETIQTGLDVDGSGSLEPASTDRITAAETAYRQIERTWWRESLRKVYPGNDDHAVTTGIRRSRISGLGIDGADGILTAEVIVSDIHGNETAEQSYIDRAGKTETRIVDSPDSETNAVFVSQKGLPVSSTTTTGITVTYGYDALGRRIRTNDPRTGAALVQYDEKGRVAYVEDAAGARTAFFYDNATGRRIAQKNAAGKYIRQAYNDRGQIIHTWGDAAYPATYVYNDTGGLTELHTFRSGAGWNSETWPLGGAGSADITRWIYDAATGLLTAKKYADGKKVSYTYKTGGTLGTRTWARTKDGRPLTTDYHYDPDTAELTEIDYSDDTPDITFTYDRIGRRKTVTDAAGTRTFAYTDSLQPAAETITGLYDQTITRNYETEGFIGRPAGFTLGAADAPEYAVAYGYDAVGRLDAVAWNTAGKNGEVNYAYIENSDLPAEISTPTGLSTTYAYEPHRNLKTSVENFSGQTLISKYAYQYDPLGRRTSVVNSGTAFARDAFNVYEYNDRSELTSSQRYNGISPSDLSGAVTEENRVYEYDPIGNRKESVAGVQQARIYETNVLNQYTAIKEGAAAIASPVYDDDGNMVEYADKKYTWNAENRLAAVEPQIPAPGDRKTVFLYDYMGRRVQKKVYAYDSDSWIPFEEKLFVYDGWNMVKEIKTIGDKTLDKYYVWGLDLSQSLQGAGGIGGLLSAADIEKAYYYLYDANGNVCQMLSMIDRSIIAHYEYDPFGNEIVILGAEAHNNPYRFSTKYFNEENHFYYYGGRYYDPEMGRWMSRDPIALFPHKLDYQHLYRFLENEPLTQFDSIGFESDSLFYREQANPSNLIPLSGVQDFISGFRVVFGMIGSILDLDIFRNIGRSPVNYNAEDHCQFLLTINGIFNTLPNSMSFPDEVQYYLPKTLGRIQNTGYVHNATTWITDILIQIPSLEAGAIGIPSLTTAQYISEAYEVATNECCESIDIYVIAHSQGAAVLNQAISLISPEVRNKMRILTLGAEQFVRDDNHQFGYVGGIDSEGDFVPELSPRNIGSNKIEVDKNDVPGHGRKNYLRYLRRKGLPSNFYR